MPENAAKLLPKVARLALLTCLFAGLVGACSDPSTVAVDETPPTVSDVSIDVSEHSVTAHWMTDEPALSYVMYGKASYGLRSYSDSRESPKSVHTAVLGTEADGWLDFGTMYKFKIGARDAEGNWSESGEDVFTTLEFGGCSSEYLMPKLVEACASTYPAEAVPTIGGIAVFSQPDQNIAWEIQQLLPESRQPQSEDDIIFAARVVKDCSQTGIYIGGGGGGGMATRCDYHIRLSLYGEARLVAKTTIRGPDPPTTIETPTIHGIPVPRSITTEPDLEDVRDWILSQIA